MSWCVAIKDTKTGKIRLMEEGESGPMDLKRFERHVVPYTKEGDEMMFGVHDFTPSCPCHPWIDKDSYEYPIVMHVEIRPN